MTICWLFTAILVIVIYYCFTGTRHCESQSIIPRKRQRATSTPPAINSAKTPAHSSFITTPDMFSFVTVDRTNPADGLPGTTLRLPNSLRCNLLHCPINCVYLFIDSSESEKVALNLQKSSGYTSKRSSWERYRNLLNQSNQPFDFTLDLNAYYRLCVSFNLTSRISLKGTSLLIVVGVAIETAKQVEGRVIKRRYHDSFNNQCQQKVKGRYKMNILLMGLPGAVKDTERSVVLPSNRTYCGPCDIFRAAIQNETPLGLRRALTLTTGNNPVPPRHCT